MDVSNLNPMLDSNSSEEETDKTREIGTQVELDKNIKVEKLVEISINTEEVSESSQKFIKKKYPDNTKGKSLLDIIFREDSSSSVEPRVLGLRGTPNIVHTELGPVTAMIPIYADAKDVCSFIRACDYACEAMDKDSIPLLVKCINTKITGNALEVCRYRETSDWETIKKILRRAFEQRWSPQTLQIGLNSVHKMEVCVDSMESTINAVNGGAHRLELCSALSEGPSLGLLKTIVSIPIFNMLRPRCGYDFQFSDLEIGVILKDCTSFKKAGADGFVFGALTSTGDIDIAACASVILTAQPLPVTFHRATQNPIKTAQKIADLGFKRLLTGGRSPVAFDGKCLIKILIETMKDRLIIIPGAGIQVDI
ncbi:hypothetical protein AGLY_014256 [Aphis glycines]|uniref:Copper homeostasis protein cutC homolog n=1 Tax=Aphis glycines TaxID=307491 RepID=A0A6G0T449_APHGL|nr:hypothetical protein AGLY_014256 [Aphis glycines]